MVGSIGCFVLCATRLYVVNARHGEKKDGLSRASFVVRVYAISSWCGGGRVVDQETKFITRERGMEERKAVKAGAVNELF